MEKGVFQTTKKDGSIYYRVSITKSGKHISLGSFLDEKDASICYKEALNLFEDFSISTSDYNENYHLSFEKFIILINFRDNKIYISKPIYLRSNYIEYYLSDHLIYKFDREELFFYSDHKLFKRGNHIFYSEYGMQLNLLEKYNIPSNSVVNKDYKFLNGDICDFRSNNIQVINHYRGVSKTIKNGKTIYVSKIHINGYIKIGEYNTEIKAAIAYNKAVDILKKHVNINYRINYPEISPKEYAEIYSEINISDKLYKYCN